MRRSIVFLAAILGVGAALTWPGISAAQSPTQDSVTGSLTEGFRPIERFIWNINVSSGPSGESPTGTIEALTFFGPLSFPVTCLQVTANRAVIGGRASGDATVVQVYLVVVDESGDVQDRIGHLFFVNDPLAPATCAEFDARISGATPPPAQSGSVVVTDAQPLPTLKEQCKNGGWRNFPVFKNEGDCVSFVATGGKSPPGS